MTDMTKTAIVTGAARGIGLGVAQALDAAGWRVASLDRDLSDDMVGQRVACDISDETSVRAAFHEIAELTADGLGLLVNNAGLAGPESGPVEELALEDWNRWIGTNLTGSFLMAKHAVPHLRTGGGSVVNITSTRASMSEPNTEPYATTKGGLTALTHALAISLGPKVRVNAIAPGWIVTGDWDELREIDHAQHPAGRAGKPSDVAEAVLYLAEAGFVTGQVITVDGGMTRKMIYEH